MEHPGCLVHAGKAAGNPGVVKRHVLLGTAPPLASVLGSSGVLVCSSPPPPKTFFFSFQKRQHD